MVQGQGGYVGDRALLQDIASDALYTAVTTTIVFALDKREYQAIVNTGAKVVAAGDGSAASGTAVAAGTSMVGGVPMRKSSVRREDLEIIRTLGAGTFGRVKLVRHKVRPTVAQPLSCCQYAREHTCAPRLYGRVVQPTNRAFAMKVLQKADVVAYAQQKNVMNERNVLMMVDHPFVLKLETTFKDAHCLYMLLEYVQGGELFTFLANSKDGFVPVDAARFYSACVLAGVAALHAQSILYRDLKPENMMIDVEGYIKIVDMGFAKFVKDRTYTLCGTPEYLAPELVLGQGHYKGVDIWAIGVLLYELVSGHSPFYDPVNNDQMVICKNIVKGKFSFPSHVKDKELKDLVTKMLVRTVTNRLGCRRDGINEVLEHKFFAPLDWAALLGKRMKAPWRPPVKDPYDTSCFEKYEGPEDIAPYTDDGSGWDADF